jgi:hypothetical protein
MTSVSINSDGSEQSYHSQFVNRSLCVNCVAVFQLVLTTICEIIVLMTDEPNAMRSFGGHSYQCFENVIVDVGIVVFVHSRVVHKDRRELIVYSLSSC